MDHYTSYNKFVRNKTLDEIKTEINKNQDINELRECIISLKLTLSKERKRRILQKQSFVDKIESVNEKCNNLLTHNSELNQIKQTLENKLQLIEENLFYDDLAKALHSRNKLHEKHVLCCPICFSDRNKMTVLECGHVTCAKCICKLTNCVDYNTKCPLCRRFSKRILTII